MKQLLISLTAIAIFYGCNKKDSLTEFPIDTKNLFVREIHEYEFYSDGQINIDRIIGYNYEKGILTDSFAFDRKQFFYNSKGKVERILDLTDSSQQFKLYDNLDSLVSDYTIVKGDTFLLERFYFQDGKKVKRISLMFAKKKSPQYLGYDTLGSVGEFVYDGQILKKQIQKYISGGVTEIYYNPTSKEGVYDFILIGTKGDTSIITKTMIQGDSQIVIREDLKEALKDTLYYDNRGRLVRQINNNLDSRYSYFFRYDDNGNLLEMRGYRNAR